MEKLTKREKVMIGVGVVGLGLAGYFGFKYYKANGEVEIFKQGMDHLLKANDNLISDNIDLQDKVTTLMEAASEGVFEEALGTVNNKINHRTDRRKYLLSALEKAPNDENLKATLEKVETELANLFKRKDKFLEAQAFYAIAETMEE